MLLLSRMILHQYTQLRLIGPNVSNIFRACSTKSAANTSTGIEHALRFKNELGQANRKDFVKDYKCIEYLNFNNYTFYDKEVFVKEMIYLMIVGSLIYIIT